MTIEVGDFLGSTDPQLMKDLVEEASIFDSFVDFNYQALCPDELECCSMGVRSFLVPTINTLVYALQRVTQFVQNLGLYALM